MSTQGQSYSHDRTLHIWQSHIEQGWFQPSRPEQAFCLKRDKSQIAYFLSHSLRMWRYVFSPGLYLLRLVKCTNEETVVNLFKDAIIIPSAVSSNRLYMHDRWYGSILKSVLTSWLTSCSLTLPIISLICLFTIVGLVLSSLSTIITSVILISYQ